MVSSVANMLTAIAQKGGTADSDRRLEMKVLGVGYYVGKHLKAKC